MSHVQPISGSVVTPFTNGPPTKNADLNTQPGPGRRYLGYAGHLVANLLALSCVAAVIYFGQRWHWNLPKYSALLGDTAPEKTDWCLEHNVPDSICIECQKDLLPKAKEFGWCRRHGVTECPLCHPSVSQTAEPAIVNEEDRERADRALAFAARVENNSKCKLHQRRIQLATEEVLAWLGIEVAPVGRAAVAEVITAPGEIVYDPTRVARLSARVPGTVAMVCKQVGDKVRAGDVLGLIDAAAVGKAKADFHQALVEEELRTRTLVDLKESEAVVPERSVQEAEALLNEAQVRLLTAEQALANLGLAISAAEIRKGSPSEIAKRMQFLGLPASLAKELAGKTGSSNLIAVIAPFDGEIVARSVVAGEGTDSTKTLFTLANTLQMRLNLRVPLEQSARVKPGQLVRFRHEDHSGGDAATVTWISPAADEKTRAVPVRVDLANPTGAHHANTFGTAEILLREEPKAIVVPSDAVHWEGDCNVVFVRDKDFEKPGSFKVFHVRKVRPGVTMTTPAGSTTEIIAGLLPGEIVATANSGILRTELLKNNLGAG